MRTSHPLPTAGPTLAKGATTRARRLTRRAKNRISAAGSGGAPQAAGLRLTDSV